MKFNLFNAFELKHAIKMSNYCSLCCKIKCKINVFNEFDVKKVTKMYVVR